MIILPGVAENLLGNRYGKLTVTEKYNNAGCENRSRWNCKCDCGNVVTGVLAQRLKSGDKQSCGCIGRNHGLSHTRLYRIWSGMICRCENENRQMYARYGQRGISVCHEWRTDFRSFYKWAKQHGYDDTLSLDRIDNDGNYEPNNCRFADNVTQARNRGIDRKNTSGVKGVYQSHNGSKWYSAIDTDNGRKWLGTFSNKQEAINARKIAEKIYWQGCPNLYAG